MQKTLIYGYGNIDREDDGVAWHILSRLAKYLNIPFPDSPSDVCEPVEGNPSIYFSLQLTPEFTEEIAHYDRVCFVDAHTGNIPDDLSFQRIEPEMQKSPFTHHLTPQSCLALCSHLYRKTPAAVLISVRGYEFNFSQNLSAKTDILANQAVSQIIDWLKQ